MVASFLSRIRGTSFGSGRKYSVLSDTTNNVNLSSIADNHSLSHGGQYILMSIKEHQGDIIFAGNFK